jgi:hypothetical protein
MYSVAPELPYKRCLPRETAMDRLGQYVIGERLGAGPYSVVYEARDGGTACALRVINDEAVPTDPGQHAGLVSTLQGLAQLEHPSVVRVVDAGEADGKLYVAMELMTCPTLERRLEERVSLDEKQIVLFVRQAAQALDKARDMGYFHGDLSAGKVFVVSEEKIKLSGFAVRVLIEEPDLAASFADGDTAAGGALGEDEWVTAEELLRAKGAPADRRKQDEDFTALGALMLRMFGLQPPDQADQRLADYRADLIAGPLAELSSGSYGAGAQTVEVIRRLLTPGGFDSPGEVVVELASAMLLRRPFVRTEAGDASPAYSAETATMKVDIGRYEASARRAGGGLESLEFQGDPRAAAFTPFFVWEGRRGGRFFLIHDGERVTLGRDPDCADIAIMDPALSRRHCILSRKGGTIRIEDLDSTNGTFVNERRTASAEITPQDTVRIGATKMFMSLPARDR